MDYREFIENKIDIAPLSGIDVDPGEVSPILKPHQRDAVLWALKGGRRGIFARFGLGKTVMQLEWCRILQKHEGGKTLIVMPLNVMPEFKLDAQNLLKMDVPPYVRTMSEVEETDAPILLTNYERVRDGDIDPHYFTAVSLDEAATLRSFGSKTYQTFMDKFHGVRYKLTNTATPSPNRYKELIHYAGFLEVMDTGQALTRFFKRDSTKANNLTLYPGREREFWIWCASWGLFLQKPSDLGHSDEGYDLPELDIQYIKLQNMDREADYDKDGQMKMGHDAAMGLQDAAREKRDSIGIRAAEVAKIVGEYPEDHFVIWHDLEDERRELKRRLPEMVDIYGSMNLETREQRVIDFANGKTRLFGTKKSLSGSGCNFQRHCHKAIFMGIDYEFNDFIQAIHRIYRFLQMEKVTIYILYMDTETEILQQLKKKWKQYDELSEQMGAIIREYGLGTLAVETLKRTIGCERVEVNGLKYTAINNDCVEEVRKTRPKLETPFKVYIYCTKGDKSEALMVGENQARLITCTNYDRTIPFGGYIANGKVIGEFVCDSLANYEAELWDDETFERIQEIYEPDDYAEYGEYEYKTIADNSDDFWNENMLCKDACLSIEDLRKYLGTGITEFYGWHISNLVIYDKPKELGEFIKTCVNDLYCEVCAMYSEFEEKCYNRALQMKRPPQSWCYVESHQTEKGGE